VTAPGGRVGEAFIRFRADTKNIEPELSKALNDAADDADKFLDDVGERWGSTLADSTSAEIRTHGRDFANSMSDSLRGQVVEVNGVQFRLDRRGFLHDLDTGQFAGRLVENIVDSLDRAAQPGGPFSKVGEGISDAIGAGFNISGRSPLIALLIPAVGAIAGLILAAVQAANALVAILTTIPALVTAIGLQLGVVLLAFDGIGEAAQKAFAAENAEQMNEALKGLTPSARTFVESLVDARDVFREMKEMVQENFFRAFGDTISQLIRTLGPVLAGPGMASLATAMGLMFREIGLFFGSPTFIKFVNDVIPATIRWLGMFGPGFVDFLTALVKMSDTALPFLESLGRIVGNAFATFSKWLGEKTESGELTEWLDRMATTLQSIVEFGFKAAEFIASFMESLDQAGGDKIIDTFSDILEMFAWLVQNEEFMRGLVNTVIFLSQAFAGLVIGIMSVIAFFQFLADAIGAFFTWLTEDFGPGVGEFFTETLPGFFEDMIESVSRWAAVIVVAIQDVWDDVTTNAQKSWNSIIEFFKSIPGRIIGAVGNLGMLLFDAGRQILQGLKDGAQWVWDHTVGPFFNWVTQQIPNWKGPMEKDKMLLYDSGKAVMQGFSSGIQEGANELKGMLGDFTKSISFSGFGSTNTFNSNLNFFGQQPTTSQARSAGRAVSEELNSQVVSRDVQLAVRVI